MIQRPAAHARGHRHAIAHLGFESRPSPVQQIVPHVCGTRRRISARQFNCRAGDGLFVVAGRASKALDHLAIAIARFAIHARIDLRRIAAQDVFHPADAFKKDLPILGRQDSQADDAMGDQFVVRNGRAPGWHRQRFRPWQLGNSTNGLS